MFLVAITHRVASALDDASVPYAVVKGPVLAEHVYPEPSWRAYRDLDVLVTSSDAPRARAALESMGARLAPIQREITDLGFDGEVAMLLPEGLNIDLHHELVNDRDARQHFTVPIGELLHRRGPSTHRRATGARPDRSDAAPVPSRDINDASSSGCSTSTGVPDSSAGGPRSPGALWVRSPRRSCSSGRLILHPIHDDVLDGASAELWATLRHHDACAPPRPVPPRLAEEPSRPPGPCEDRRWLWLAPWAQGVRAAARLEPPVETKARRAAPTGGGFNVTTPSRNLYGLLVDADLAPRLHHAGRRADLVLRRVRRSADQ
jgi:hypothetical protein